MPVKTPDCKATSPSKLVQGVINQSWGGQVGTTDPKQALNQSPTKHPIKVGNGK